jgi:hypothetical protein
MEMSKPRRLPAIACILAMFAVFAPPSPVRAADGFFSGLPDLPLMPKLGEDRAAAVVFDKPEGRIVTLTARGRVSRNAVMGYYARALPQLGWKMDRPGRFRRDGEILLLTTFGTGKDLTVRISLAPE